MRRFEHPWLGPIVGIGWICVVGCTVGNKTDRLEVVLCHGSATIAGDTVEISEAAYGENAPPAVGLVESLRSHRHSSSEVVFLLSEKRVVANERAVAERASHAAGLDPQFGSLPPNQEEYKWWLCLIW